eukprot:GILK01010053.1.p1 GENE.GILK01010053.1~~GILK01010053.1.p1  ORF type:complete len:524 (+),score=38.23 GILK01010053.1:25-1572(+)
MAAKAPTRITSASSLFLVQDFFGRPVAAVSNGDLEKALRGFHILPSHTTYRGEMMDILSTYLVAEPIELLQQLLCDLASAKTGEVVNRRVLSAFFHPLMTSRLSSMIAQVQHENDKVQVPQFATKLPQEVKTALLAYASASDSPTTTDYDRSTEASAHLERRVILSRNDLPQASTDDTSDLRRGSKKRVRSDNIDDAAKLSTTRKPKRKSIDRASLSGFTFRGTLYHVGDYVSLDAADTKTWGICPAQIISIVSPLTPQEEMTVCVRLCWIGTNLTGHAAVREQPKCFLQGQREERTERVSVIKKLLVVLSQQRYIQQFGNLLNQNVCGDIFYYGGEIDEATNRLTLRKSEKLDENKSHFQQRNSTWACLQLANTLRHELPHFDRWTRLDTSRRVSVATVRATAFEILATFSLSKDEELKERVQRFWYSDQKAKVLSLEKVPPDSLAFLLGPFSTTESSCDFWGLRVLKDQSSATVIQVNLTVKKNDCALDSIAKLTVELYFNIANEFGFIQTVM